MKRTLLLIISAMALLSVSPWTRGQGVSGVLNDQFNTMATTTSPGAYMGSRRGVITGGRVSIRANVVNPGPLVSLTPPSLRTGGCGDLDAVGGAFSFVSGDELTALLRNIASNAGTYAFSLALSSMCPSCSAKMEKWQEEIQKLNINNINSCEAAMRLVNKTGLDEWAERRKRGQATANGGKEDDQDSNAQGPGEENSSTTLSEEELKDLDPGNLIWRMLKSQNFSRWMSGAAVTDDLLMDLMSYIGTTIVCTDSRNDCRQSEESQVRPGGTVVTPVMHTLTLEDLLEGSGRMSGDLAGRNVRPLRCVGEASDAGGCLNVVPTALSNWEGMAVKIERAIVGIPAGAPDSMISRIRAGSEPTQLDNALMTHARAYTSMVVNLARRSEYAAQEFARTYAREIALEITRNTMDQMLRGAAQAALSFQGGNAEEATRLLEKANRRLWQEQRDIKRANESSAVMLQYYMQLMEVMPPAALPSIPGAQDAPTS